MTTSTKARSYYDAADELRRELNEFFPKEEIRALHDRKPIKHFAIVIRQFLLLFACGWVCWHVSNPLIWIPVALLEGFTIFNFTVLLHEQVHRAIFKARRPRLMRFLGLLYAFPSGISATQFHVWHMDHHENLGDEDDDPKRHYLSPKRVARWYKLLYCTPVLFPIYFRAARKETASYPQDLQKRIAVERTVTIGLHLAIAVLLGITGGWAVLARTYLIPYFLVFPIAFTLNRLGQHYIIDPADPRKWSSRVDGNWAWRFLFLNSNHHLEHHYFQSVPFYNLPKLNRMLRPYFEKHGVDNLGYGQILWHWFVQNHVPHTRLEPARGELDLSRARTTR
ncbi:MAG: fatty acid desaturase [Candidatus Eisenbacteria bacterium]|uniref:Fatty acid desaturase n=1 Tax=Eiseniibacteriota bacterium TaxID=2212470 RepID=A0A956LZ17_UNCEI|nr:fatty acid desaturase [Candidatus Eisenbacteria bacterium]